MRPVRRQVGRTVLARRRAGTTQQGRRDHGAHRQNGGARGGRSRYCPSAMYSVVGHAVFSVIDEPIRQRAGRYGVPDATLNAAGGTAPPAIGVCYLQRTLLRSIARPATAPPAAPSSVPSVPEVKAAPSAPPAMPPTIKPVVPSERRQ